MALIWSLISTFLISAISLIGIFTLLIKKEFLQQILFYLISFSAGALIGGAFLYIIPEILEQTRGISVFYYIIAGIVLFFMLERYFFWRHCHEESCNIHAFTYLNLVGEGLHNFIDGMMVAASFRISVNMGVATTLAVISHEIPKELGNFGVLVYGGLSRQKALFFNFLTGLTAVVGALFAYFMSDIIKNFSNFILPLTAGGFIYIAASDLIPQIHKEKNRKRSTAAFVAFLAGIIFMALAKTFLKH